MGEGCLRHRQGDRKEDPKAHEEERRGRQGKCFIYHFQFLYLFIINQKNILLEEIKQF